jgi:hypothetical protein
MMTSDLGVVHPAVCASGLMLPGNPILQSSKRSVSSKPCRVTPPLGARAPAYDGKYYHSPFGHVARLAGTRTCTSALGRRFRDPKPIS